MYFPDLSPYSYDDHAVTGRGHRRTRPNVLNVGWLSAQRDFPRRVPDRAFLASLKRLAQSPVELYRGYHICEFCPPPREIRSSRGILIEPLPRTTGNGEIRVSGSDGTIFAAPVLIVHYVETHEYAPPEVFVEAVLRANM